MNKQNQQHQAKIKQDQEDLQKLSLQLQKVQKLKKEYVQQKQQIGDLKSAISELKSQNDELRSQSSKKQFFQSNNKNKVSGESQNVEEEDEILLSRKKEDDEDDLKHRKEVDNQDETFTQKIKTKSRMWNRSSQNQAKPNQFRNLKQESLAQPLQSVRNNSGFITSVGRMLSPQAKSHLNSYGSHNRQNNEGLYWAQPETQSKYETNYISTKNRIVDNFVADLKYEIEEKEAQLYEERNNHKQTKKTLKKTLSENERLSQLNGKFYEQHSYLQRQNQVLENELLRETQAKYKTESLIRNFYEWHNTVGKRCYDELERQFLAMDEIYYDFERIRNARKV